FGRLLFSFSFSLACACTFGCSCCRFPAAEARPKQPAPAAATASTATANTATVMRRWRSSLVCNPSRLPHFGPRTGERLHLPPGVAEQALATKILLVRRRIRIAAAGVAHHAVAIPVAIEAVGAVGDGAPAAGRRR